MKTPSSSPKSRKEIPQRRREDLGKLAMTPNELNELSRTQIHPVAVGTVRQGDQQRHHLGSSAQRPYLRSCL